MRVAVLGGGFQGCCVAMALASRGIRVTIFDRGSSLMSRTAIANEGKVHLGYMYAADPTLRTAKTMMKGALAFGPFIARMLGQPLRSFVTSQPASYVVHRDSQHSSSYAIDYLNRTHHLIGECAGASSDDYFHQDLRRPLKIWERDEIAAEFDSDAVASVIQTPEVAIDPIALMDQIRSRVVADPLITVRLQHEVCGSADNGSRVSVRLRADGQLFTETFDHAVNSLWEGRLAVDATMGLMPKRSWLHRLKYGIHLKWHMPREAPRSCTVISGPFGEVVNYPDGTIYLTWYPHCVTELSSDVTPPFWETHPPADVSRRIVRDTVASMSQFIHKLKSATDQHLVNAKVKGGPIFAWGSTDIHDRQSELHQRYDIGVLTAGRYHSVDPGKLTMAPYFADLCASRIAGSA